MGNQGTRQVSHDISFHSFQDVLDKHFHSRTRWQDYMRHSHYFQTLLEENPNTDPMNLVLSLDWKDIATCTPEGVMSRASPLVLDILLGFIEGPSRDNLMLLSRTSPIERECLWDLMEYFGVDHFVMLDALMDNLARDMKQDYQIIKFIFFHLSEVEEDSRYVLNNLVRYLMTQCCVRNPNREYPVELFEDLMDAYDSGRSYDNELHRLLRYIWSFDK